MRKELYFKLLNYLWDVKESNEDVTVDLRMLEKNSREPIVVYINGEMFMYIDVMDENYNAEVDGVTHLGISFEEIKEAIEDVL